MNLRAAYKELIKGLQRYLEGSPTGSRIGKRHTYSRPTVAGMVKVSDIVPQTSGRECLYAVVEATKKPASMLLHDSKVIVRIAT
jgi:hypothetical protein